MRDFPFFDTETGVSSLILKEIPYRQQAYIHIREIHEEGFGPHLKECVSFCRMAGAEQICAAGHPSLEGFAEYTRVIKYAGTAWVDKQMLASLFPVTEQTASRWREIYNEKMRRVDNAATLEKRDEEGLVASGGGYFIHDAGKLLGIGWLEDTKLLAVAAAEPGAGSRVMHSLMSLVEGSAMTIEVASTNKKAIRLYEKLGFLPVEEISRWYDVTGIK